MRLLDEIFPLVEGFYVDLHRNPELSHQEHRTARSVAEWLSRAGYEVTAGIGGTGVVGVLRNGPGPTVLLRAAMDALPVAERTSLPYASTARGVDADGDEVPVMHACAHDAHTACLVGTADLLASAREQWSGTLLVVAQPGEETLDGAAGMLAERLYPRFGRPDVALAQHIGSAPAGLIQHRAGTILGTSARLKIRVFGSGGPSTRPHTTVDPVMTAASIVTRLQTVVAREIDPKDAAMVNVGVMRAGARVGAVPDEAYLEIDTRTLTERAAAKLHTAIERVVHAESQASGAPRAPEIVRDQRARVTDNNPDQTAVVAAAHRAFFGDDYVLDLPDPIIGSEDFPEFGLPDDPDPVPYVYWFIGGTPHETWNEAPGETPYEKLAAVPEAHAPDFAPDREPTLRAGLAAMTMGALAYLGRADAAGDSAPDMARTGERPPPVEAAHAAFGDHVDPEPPEEPAAAAAEETGESTHRADMADLLADHPEETGESTHRADMANLLADAPEETGESTHAADMAELLDPPSPARGPTRGTATGPSESLAGAEPPSGPAYPAPPPQGPPVAAPPPTSDDTDDEPPHRL
ncbi:amidohydrolase [Salinactinospora qingdaonensis]